MRVTFLGTGSAMPLPDRHQTGLLVDEDGRYLLVDCGAGVLHRLEETGVGAENVSTVILTHHHLDHVSDLMALLKARWLAGEEHLEVVGPQGTKALVDGLLDVHDYLDGRVDLAVREVGEYDFEVAGFELEGHRTEHSKPCLAYRFDDRFAFSGDGEATEALASFADGVAVFVHDCSFPDSVDVDNHPTPTQLGAALSGHEYGRVYLTHLYPHTEGVHDEMLAAVSRGYDGDVRFAEDLLSVTIE
jgi:ribonuclease BN (tRNA processing enzyme)